MPESHGSSPWHLKATISFHLNDLAFVFDLKAIKKNPFTSEHLARNSERGKKTRQTAEVGRQYTGVDRPGVPRVPEGIGQQRNMEQTGCEVICVP